MLARNLDEEGSGYGTHPSTQGLGPGSKDGGYDMGYKHPLGGGGKDEDPKLGYFFY